MTEYGIIERGGRFYVVRMRPDRGPQAYEETSANYKTRADAVKVVARAEQAQADNTAETTCPCGWNGKTRPGARGQRCPSCGESLS